MSLRTSFSLSLVLTALAVIVGNRADAAVISATFDQTLTTSPVTISFDGVGGFLFTSASTGYGPGAAVATTGKAMVSTAFSAVTDFEASASIDQTGELYTFASYPGASPIPFSAADDFIGLALTLNDGVHYGYAEVAGPELVSVGFESTAGATILTGATGGGSGITLTTGTSGGGGTVSTPEPASALLLIGGVAALAIRRRVGGQIAA